MSVRDDRNVDDNAVDRHALEITLAGGDARTLRLGRYAVPAGVRGVQRLQLPPHAVAQGLTEMLHTAAAVVRPAAWLAGWVPTQRLVLLAAAMLVSSGRSGEAISPEEAVDRAAFVLHGNGAATALIATVGMN